jgi:hypothetical protein
LVLFVRKCASSFVVFFFSSYLFKIKKKIPTRKYKTKFKM